MRILGLDLGTKSLGIAISDETLTFSLPLKTIKFDSFEESLEELKNKIGRAHV